jgi:quinoprotein glucose dehydrogenase
MKCSFLILVLVTFTFSCTVPEESQVEESIDQPWPVASASKGNTKYSPLNQINRDNVHQLQVAWEYRGGDEGYSIECNPIVVDRVLYATSPSVNVFALNAATGEEIWTFDPFAYVGDTDRMRRSSAVNRGLVYWEEGEDQRIFIGVGPFLFALDARSGEPITSFGEQGKIDLLNGLDRDVEGLWINASSPGIIYRDLIIVGAQVGEGEGPTPPGHVRAFDVRSGERKWIFHTIPYPGEYGYDTWPKEAWKTFGGANAWGGFSLDEERGLVFFGTGSASHDHFGIERHGQNLFANSVVALNAATGERVWHYQVVHHDLWDYDLPTPPNLITVEHNGERIDAVAQVTKVGMLFLFNRETGEPLFPVEERPVPQTEVPGEQTWPTQPFPTRPQPYARQTFREEDITNRTPEAHAFVRENVYDKYGDAQIYDPPSFAGDIIFPQFNGGTDWGGAAVDPETGFLYVNASNEPELMRVVEADEDADFPYNVTGHQPVKDNEGFPIATPPWGTLSAIDLNQGVITWQVPFGTYPELEGTTSLPTGTFNMGGPVVTAGGLVFLGGSMDEKFRAFDKETGEVLWEAKLPAGGYATPATYSIDGKQYVVIGAGGGGKPGTRTGDAYVAFALPDGDTTSDPDDSPQATAVVEDEGLQLYTSRCASCHQYNGQGLAGNYPPLIDTDWVTGDKGRLIRLVLGGLNGELEVNGVEYNQAMPPWGGFLDDEQIASILTHVRTSWGNRASAVSAEEVGRVRAATQSQTGMWTAEELMRKENQGIPE